jgi:uncharacterized protein
MAFNRSTDESAKGVKAERWVPSRFNVRTEIDGELILYNSFTGAMGAVLPEERDTVLSALKRAGVEGALTGVLKDLQAAGFFVKEGTDEFRRAQLMHAERNHRTSHLHLILMPSEDCNFRCVYCYENFKMGKMWRGVRKGLKRFVAQKAPMLQHLHVDWFGGEPLTATDVIDELSTAFRASCQEHDVEYVSSITTNAYHLDEATASLLFEHNCRQLQITLDGPPAQHDQRRILADGGPTFEVIFNNLKALKQRPEDFLVDIRVNFDRESLPAMGDFLRLLRTEFHDDRRFAIYFRPIGQWGGPHDASLPVCYGTQGELALFALVEEAIGLGLGHDETQRELLPHGAVCYAARPNSFLVGGDGIVYKCTVALDNDINKVGKLLPSGEMALDRDKFALWVTSDATGDSTCERCFFRPACHGAACPLERIEHAQRPCPPVKNHIKRALRVIHMTNQGGSAQGASVLS